MRLFLHFRHLSIKGFTKCWASICSYVVFRRNMLNQQVFLNFKLKNLYSIFLSEYEPNLEVVSHFKAFESLFTRILSKDPEQIKGIIEDRSIRISYIKLIENTQFLDDFKDFQEKLKNDPAKTLAAAGMAIHHVVESNLTDENVNRTSLQVFRMNLIDHRPVLSFTKLTGMQLDTLITIRGAGKCY